MRRSHSVSLLLVLLGLLTIIAGCATISTQSSEPIVVKRAELSKAQLPYGTTQFNIFNSRINQAELFGPPVTEARPKEGYQFVVLDVSVNARSDKKWKELVQSVHFIDSTGTKYMMDAWYFKGAYRSRALLGWAKGVKSSRETHLFYHVPDPLPDGLKLIIGEKEKRPLKEFLGLSEIIKSQPVKKTESGMNVYSVVNGLQLRPEPAVSSKGTGVEFRFGKQFQVVKSTQNWLLVRDPETEREGWAHRATLNFSAEQIRKMQKIEAIPSAIVFVFNMQNASSAEVAILEGGLRLGNKRVLADQGTCVVFNDEPGISLTERSMKGFGVDQAILSPKPWILYFYNSSAKEFQAVPDLITEGKKLVVGAPLPAEPAVLGAHSESKLPYYSHELRGNNPVRIVNPNDFSVNVGLRSNGRGKDFTVPSNGLQTVYVPNGHYEIYFEYSTDENALYKGDDFSLSNNGVEIKIVKVVDGNYGIRKVK
ncbi:MAG: hypothetical protein IMF11_19055 [Proteobacteria bacterium]|nr:hypothetical protein [Pseudomonadota bacterium]